MHIRKIYSVVIIFLKINNFELYKTTFYIKNAENRNNSCNFKKDSYNKEKIYLLFKQESDVNFSLLNNSIVIISIISLVVIIKTEFNNVFGYAQS